jgi:hypothetical protein
MEVYTKIDTMYKRYIFDGKVCPKKEWLKFKNKIILGEFSNKTAEYLFHCPWEAYSKIDGTNSKIAFFPSVAEFRVEGKTEKADSQMGQFEYLNAIGERIKPQLTEMFPKETARFAPVKDGNKIVYYIAEADDTLKVNYWEEERSIAVLGKKKDPNYSSVKMEEVPIYIYGEYFGKGIQKCGGRYIKDAQDFIVFDIKQQGWWLPRENREAICKDLGLKTVPYLGIMTLAEIEKMVRAGFTTRFEGASDPTLLEEGIVARPTIPLFDSRGNRVIVKVKYCDYIEYDAVRKEFSDEEFAEFDKWYHENVENFKF